MDSQDALQLLTALEGKKPSEIGEAVDVLHKKHGSYEDIARQLSGVRPAFLSRSHRIFQLPQGILWKIDEGKITTTQGYQISRITNESDLWLLAVTIVEKNLSATECEKIVDNVLKRNLSMHEALSAVAGVKFEEISPPTLLLPVKADIWFALTKLAWSRGEDWQDFCYQAIRQCMDVDIKDTASQLEALAGYLRKAGETQSEEASP